MKRLLAISWEMPPMYGPRAAQVSRVLGELATLGWAPTVVCMDPRRGGPHWFGGAAVVAPAIRVVRVPSPQESFVARSLWRILPRLRDYPDSARPWVAPATRAAVTVAASEPHHVLISFAQPWSSHLVGLRVHRATQLPWVAHFSDPWADSPYASVRQRAIWRPMEQLVVESAAALVFVTEETADLVMRKYPTEYRRKVAIVPHGYEAIKNAEHSHDAPSTTRPVRMLHAGRFYSGARTPSMLLQALADVDRRHALRGRLEVTFLGPHSGEFAGEAASLGLSGIVRFIDRVPLQDAALAAAESDVLLVIDAPSGGPSVFLPSKLIDYLAFRKPILGLTPQGASARLLRQLECPVVPPDDRSAIAHVVDGVLRDAAEGKLRVSESFDRVAAAYDIRCTARALHDLLTRIASDPAILPRPAEA